MIILFVCLTSMTCPPSSVGQTQRISGKAQTWTDVRLPEFNSGRSLVMCPWENDVTSLCLSFLVCKMEAVIIYPANGL